MLFFGTYDVRRHPRVLVLQEGFAAHGDAVIECNQPLGDDTATRVRILQRPWLAPLLVARLLSAWARLLWEGLRTRHVDAVVVGYLGHLDVHLARLLWPRTPLALDHMISLKDTAADRGVTSGVRPRLLSAVDRAAVAVADMPFVDTEDHLTLLAPRARARSVVVPVGAPDAWFTARGARSDDDRLDVVFFGLYTPLQGAPVIGRCIALLAHEDGIHFTMIGSGQDLMETRACAGDAGNATWVDWLPASELRTAVAASDVCLGIFGTGVKAQRVVPNKVFQGAAAGCAVVTADTTPQRRALGGAATYVPPGDATALADAIRRFARDRALLRTSQMRARSHADSNFRPSAVTSVLRESLSAAVEEGVRRRSHR